MKRYFSIILAIAMVLSTMSVFSFGSSATIFDDWGYEEWPEGMTAKKKGYQTVEALYFENEPTIDGSITEAEWGAVTRRMISSEAATYNDSKSYFASYFYWQGVVTGAEYTGAGIEYDLWLRWDENNFYVGVKVKDYDGHSLKHGLKDTVNGDSVQFRVDPYYNFANLSRDRLMGWSDASTVSNILFGYSQVAGEFFECYDDATASAKGLTAYSDPKWGAANVAVAPAGSDYSPDAVAGYTTYEIALPWKYVYENNNYYASTDNTPYKLTYDEFDGEFGNGMGGIGIELGMAVAVYNAAEGESTCNSYLAWGSGAAGASNDPAQKKYNQKSNTCTGANLVLLSDAKVDPDAGTFIKYDPSVLESSEVTPEYETEFVDYLSLNAENMGVARPVDSYHELTTLTYDANADGELRDMDILGNETSFMGSIRDIGGEHGNVLVFDRAISPYDMNGYDKMGVEGGPNTWQVGVDPIPSFYMATQMDMFTVWRFPCSYTLEFDVRCLSTDISAEGNAPVLALWFGGQDGVSYECGYSFEDEEFLFCPMRRENEAIAETGYNLIKGQWYNWKFQFDNKTGTVRLFVNDELVIDSQYRYAHNSMSDVTSMYFWFINTQIEIDNVKIYNLYNYTAAEKHNVSVNGEVVGRYSAGETVELKADLGKEQRFISWSGDVAFADATSAETTFIMPDTDVTVEYTFSLIGDVNANGEVNIVDIYALKYAFINRAEYNANCDVDEDGKVNLKDMYKLKYILTN